MEIFRSPRNVGLANQNRPGKQMPDEKLDELHEPRIYRATVQLGN